MEKADFHKIETYMLQCMKDCAHDKDHVYRVLFMALDIARQEQDVNIDILITSCLLHDIGRSDQFNNPKLRHEEVGSQKAYTYLIDHSYPIKYAEHVQECILSHRFRSDKPPVSIEARILFDADKLDVTGTIGIARTLLYKGIVNDPIYTLDEQGNVLDGTDDSQPSFFHEYKYKLEKIYDKFYTMRGKQIAEDRKDSAISFYNNMLKEVRSCYTCGNNALSTLINDTECLEVI